MAAALAMACLTRNLYRLAAEGMAVWLFMRNRVVRLRARSRSDSTHSQSKLNDDRGVSRLRRRTTGGMDARLRVETGGLPCIFHRDMAFRARLIMGHRMHKATTR